MAQRVCHALDIHVVAGPAGAYQGYATQELTLHNGASDSCFVPAPPEIDVVLGNGEHRSTSVRANLTIAGASNGQVGLVSGHDVMLLIGTPATCANVGNPVMSNVLTLSLLSNEIVSVSGVAIDVECANPTLLLFEDGQPAVSTVPASALQGRLILPGAATTGQALIYFVALTNPTSQIISFDPCPSYTESFGIGNVVRDTYLLNCAVSGPLAANSTSTFEMSFDLPANTAKGMTKLGWQLDVPAGVFLGSAIRIN